MDPFRQKLCIWAGPVSLASFLIGMSFTGFTLPMSSELRPEEVVAFYQQHRVGIRIAAIFSLFCSGFMMMFAAAISAQLQRIEGRTTPWVFVQLMGGIGFLGSCHQRLGDHEVSGHRIHPGGLSEIFLARGGPHPGAPRHRTAGTGFRQGRDHLRDRSPRAHARPTHAAIRLHQKDN
jgi:hypothetical protein